MKTSFNSVASVIVKMCGILMLISTVAANQVVSVMPSQNQHAAPVSSNFVVTFDEMVTAGTVNASTCRIHSNTKGPVTGSFSTDLMDFTFDPTANFFPGEILFTTITSGIEAGGEPVIPFIWHFRTAVSAGYGTLVQGSQVLTANYSSHIAICDVDGDGDLDAIVTDTHTKVYLNDGAGNFSNSAQDLG